MEREVDESSLTRSSLNQKEMTMWNVTRKTSFFLSVIYVQITFGQKNTQSAYDEVF